MLCGSAWPVNTVGYACEREDGKHSRTDRLRQDGDGFVLNDDGARSAVVHQWVRCWDQLLNFVGSAATMGPEE